MKTDEFKKGQLVKRLGYTTKPYRVIGYNGGGMVIVIPYDEQVGLDNRSLFMENQLITID